MMNFLKTIFLFIVLVNVSVTASLAAETWGYESTSSNCTLNAESWRVSLSMPTKYATGDETPILVAVTNNSGLSQNLIGGTIKIKELDTLSDDLVLEKSIGSIYFENGTTYYFRLAGNFNPFTELGVAKVFAEIDSQVDFGPTTACATPAKSLSSGLMLDSIAVTGPASLNQNQTGQFYSELVFNDGTRLLDHTPISSPADTDSVNRMVAWSTAAPGTMQPTGSFKAGSVAATTKYDVLAVSTYNNGYITGKKSFDIVKPIYTLYTYVNIAEWGTVSKGGDYATGETVTIQAYPAVGYEFKEWSGASSSTSNPTTVTITDNVGVTANFTPIIYNYKLTVSANPTTGGSVTGGGTYSSSTMVNVKATPAAGYTFTGWSGDASGTENPIGIGMSGDKTVTAEFSQNQAPPTDTIPNPFSFTEQTSVARNTSIIPSSITVSGIDAAASISVLGGDYSIDGGNFTTASQTVTAGQSVRVRVTSSASYSTKTSVILTIGGVNGTFSVTTEASTSGGDTTPDAFYFVDQSNVTLSTRIISNAIIVTGINTAAPIFAEGGSYSIDGGPFTYDSGTVINGQSVRVRTTSLAGYSSTMNMALTIGVVSDTFSVTTMASNIVGIPRIPIVPDTNNNGSFTVSWGESSTTGVIYVLEEATNSSFTLDLRTAYSGTTPGASITGKINGNYYYRVKATLSGYQDSALQTGGNGCAVSLPLPLPKPTSITVPANDLDGNYTVTWGASDVLGVTYVLQEARDSIFSNSLRTVYSGTDLVATISGKSGGFYFYRVKAIKGGHIDSEYNTFGNNFCRVDYLVPGVPSSITIPNNDPDGVYEVSWGASSTDGVVYVLVEATNSSFTSGVRIAYSGTSTSTTLTGVASGIYYYRVKATKSGYLDSEYLDGGNACTTTTPVTGTPSSLTVPTRDSEGQYIVSWSPSSTADATYVLEESLFSSNSGFSQIYQGQATSKSITKSGYGTYFYRVKAVKAGITDSGYKPATNGCVVSTPLPGSQKWNLHTDRLLGNGLSSAAIGNNDTIYFGSNDYNLYAINTAGSQEWVFLTGGRIESSPAIGADGAIYVGSLDHNLYAINPDGTQKWIFTTGGWVVSSPSIGGDRTIYVGSHDHNLYAINPDGTQKWVFTTGGAVQSSPTIGTDGTIYVSSSDGNLYAISPDGIQKWLFTTGGGVDSSPAIGADGTIYVGSYDKNLYAINPDGTQKWAFTTGGEVRSSPAIGADGTIYVGSYDKYLYAINPDGTQKWSFMTGEGVSSPPAIGIDGTIYIGSGDAYNYYNEGYIYAIYGESGGVADTPWPMFGQNPRHTSLYLLKGTPPPSILVPENDADGEYMIAWGALSAPGVTYVIQEATDSNFTNDLRIVYSGIELNATIVGKGNGSYFYRVKATRSGYEDSPYVIGSNGCAVTLRALIPGSITVPSSDPDGSYAVSWGPLITPGTTYALEEATNSNFTNDFRTVYIGSGVNTTVTGKSNGSYYYRVKAFRSGYEDSAYLIASNGCEVSLPLPTVAAPANISIQANDDNGEYLIAWGASSTPGVTYVLQEATTNNFTSNLRIAYSGTGLTTTVSGKSNGSYYYRVMATRSGYDDSPFRIGGNACTVLIPLAATPASISVPTNSANGDFIIAWGVSSTPGVTYVLEEATNNNFTSGLRTAYNGTGLTATISGKVNGSYYYRVRATATGYTDSEYLKSSFGCQVLIPLAAIPVSITVPISDDDGEYTIAWGVSSSPGVTYVLDEATDSNFTSGLRVAYSGVELNATISAKPNGSYYYRVKATRSGYDDSAYLTASNGCDVSLPLPTAATPVSISVPTGDNDGEYTISWGASSTPGVTYFLEEFTDSNFTSGLRIAYSGTEQSVLISGKSDGTFYYRIKATASGYNDSEYQHGSRVLVLFPPVSANNLKWAFATGGVVISSPAIANDGTIYVGSSDNNLYAINPAGNEKWAFATGGAVTSSPAISTDGTVYVGSSDNNLYAVAPDGTQKWAFVTAGGVESSPAIGADGTIYVGSFDNNLYAINPDGTQKWAFATGDRIYASPAIGVDGTVYVGSYDYNMYAINPDGTQKWVFPAQGVFLWTSPAIASDGTIYVSSSMNMHALNPDGTEKWAFPSGSGWFASPVLGEGGTIYLSSYDYLYAINPDGSEKWAILGDFQDTPALAADGTIHVGSGDHLYAINPDSSVKWAFTTGGGIASSPVIGTDGSVYIGSQDNTLYALIGDSGGLADTVWPMFGQNLRHTSLPGDALPTGDANYDGKVDVTDALAALKMSVGKQAVNLVRCDVAPYLNGRPSPDGQLTAADALVILRKAVGLVNW